MIALPARQPLWLPSRRLRLPGVRDVMGWIQRDPTTGAACRNTSNGGAIQGTDAHPDCGCTTYIRAKKCSDNTYDDVWVKQADIPSYPYVFLSGSQCYKIDSGNTTSTSPTGITVAYVSGGPTSCTDNKCKYVQAKKCSDDSDADLWFPPGSVLPIYFTKFGVSYYVNSTCNFSSTPGTLATGITLTTGCFSCARCASPGKAKKKYLVTISGINLCCWTDTSDNTKWKLDTDPNGSYEVTLGTNPSHPCQGNIPLAGLIRQYFTSCGGTATGTTSAPADIIIDFATGTIIQGGGALIDATIPAGTDCASGFTVLDNHVDSCNSLTGRSPGTVTIVVSPL